MTVPAIDGIDGGAQYSGSGADEKSAGGGLLAALLRILCLSAAALVVPFFLNNYLIFWRGWPEGPVFLANLGWFGFKPQDVGEMGLEATIQSCLYLGVLLVVVVYVLARRKGRLGMDASYLSALSAFVVRGAFWAVLLVGVADMTISLLRVEGFLPMIVGDEMTTQLGRTSFRGTFVHYPLVIAGFVIALFTRSLGFIWLALLIVGAEFMIVISRFVFSYEQAYMGDLVRFWYAALFLFASAYTLLHEGHVRVDIFYTRFSERGKAWCNLLGSLALGMPLCWIIMTRGLWSKASLINAPLLSFEVSQSGYGMYVKYFMASFLMIYALSMLLQFASYVLSSAAVLVGEPHAAPEKHSDAL